MQKNKQLLILTMEYGNISVTQLKKCNDYILIRCYKSTLIQFTSAVNRVKGMPPIGKADHDIVYIEYDIKAKRIQQAPRKIFLYKRADMDERIWTVSMTI